MLGLSSRRNWLPPLLVGAALLAAVTVWRCMDDGGNAKGFIMLDPAPPVEVDVLDLESRLQRFVTNGGDDSWIETELARGVNDATDGEFSYSHVGRYRCADVAFVVPVFVHLETGLEFSLLPGGMARVGQWPAYSRARDLPELRDTASYLCPPADVRVPSMLVCQTKVSNHVWRRGRVRPRVSREAADAVVGISQAAAVKWCRRRGLDLPTEFEWEYAARAGSIGPYCWGTLEELPAVVEAMPNPSLGLDGVTNAFGLRGIHASVAEYVLEPWDPEWVGLPPGWGGPPSAMVRGGEKNWIGGGPSPIYEREYADWRQSAPFRASQCGFRPVVRLAERGRTERDR